MIKVKIRGPTALEGVAASIQKEYPFGRRKLWIGRGEEVADKQNEHNYVLNMADISKSVSRIHACLILSPSFWMGYDYAYPSYYKKLGPSISLLPDNLLFQIWQFSRPARKILLKDMHSKTGVYKKIKSQTISPGMEIVLGDSRPIMFHHQEIYDSKQELRERVEWLRQRQYVLINEHFGGEVRSFWVLSFKNQQFILLDVPCKLTIGRSSNNNFVICEASISRKHATLQYKQPFWKIWDGDGTPSSNGVWQRVRKLHLDYRSKSKQMNGGESTVKLGDILFSFDIKEDYSHLNISELCVSHKISTNNQSFSSLLKKEMEELPLARLNQASQQLCRKGSSRKVGVGVGRVEEQEQE